MADHCPDTAVLADFAHGAMAALQRSKIELHLAECPVCRELLSTRLVSGKGETGAAAASRRNRPGQMATAPPGVPRKGQRRRWMLASVALLVALLTAALFYGFRTRADQYEDTARTAFRAGNYTQVEEACRRLQRRAVGPLLLGQVCFLRGDLDNALAHYQRALKVEAGGAAERALALMGLGRIASEQGEPGRALQFYRQAAALCPEMTQARLAQAVVLEQQGDVAQAGALLRQAGAAADDPATVAAWIARLDRQSGRSRRSTPTRAQTAAVEPSREWSSMPLTVWWMGMESVGYSLREGEPVLLTEAIRDRLLEGKRLQLLAPDPLPTSTAAPGHELDDPMALAALGRRVGVRLVVTGRLRHHAPSTEVSLRCIESATGELVAAVDHTFAISAPISEMADRLADRLMVDLKARYPLRAKVLEKHGTKLFLDIGRHHGAVMGATLAAPEHGLTATVINVDIDKCVAQIQSGIDAVAIGLPLEEVH